MSDNHKIFSIAIITTTALMVVFLHLTTRNYILKLRK